jgi:hypothetical protein
MSDDFQKQIEREIQEIQEIQDRAFAKNIGRVKKLIAAGLDPHSTADYKTVAAAIDRECSE